MGSTALSTQPGGADFLGISLQKSHSILWRKGDFSQHLWWGESNLVECTESHDSGLAMWKPKGRGMPRVYLGTRNVKPPENLPPWEEYSVPEQQMSGLKILTAQ